MCVSDSVRVISFLIAFGKIYIEKHLKKIPLREIIANLTVHENKLLC